MRMGASRILAQICLDMGQRGCIIDLRTVARRVWLRIGLTDWPPPHSCLPISSQGCMASLSSQLSSPDTTSYCKADKLYHAEMSLGIQLLVSAAAVPCSFNCVIYDSSGDLQRLH